MTMWKPTRRSAGIIAAALSATVLAACGSGFGSDEVAQVSLNSPDGEGITLESGDSQHGSSTTVQLQSNGDKDLEITSLEMVDTPDRLHHQGSEPLSACTFDATNDAIYGNCESEQYCTFTRTNRDGFEDTHTCRDATPPETPITLAEGNTIDLNFFLGANPEGERYDCPEAPGDISSGLEEGYCGELRIETNASSDNGPFENGNATLYFQVNSDKSGEINTPGSLDFESISPGVTQERTFSIDNVGDNPLTVNTITISEYTNLITLSPAGQVEIAADSSQTYTVTIDIPEDYDISQLSSPVYLNIDSTANPNGPGESVIMNLDIAAGSGPALEYTPKSLTFADGTSKTVTLSNTGSQELSFDGMSFEPSSLSNSYEVTTTVDGEQKQVNATTLDPPADGEDSTDATLEVEYTGDGTDDVGQLILEHDDESRYERSEVMLLGDEDNGYTELVSREQYNFRFSQSGERQFVLHNRGTSEVNVSVDFSDVPPYLDIPESAIPSKSSGDTATIPAGGLLSGTVTFAGTESESGQPKQPKIRFTTDGIQSALEMDINVSTDEGQTRSASIVAADGEQLTVGETTRLTLEGETKDPSTVEWFVLDRPDGSEVFAVHDGNELLMRPDTAGTYKVAVTLRGGNGPELQTVKELEAVAAD